MLLTSTSTSILPSYGSVVPLLTSGVRCVGPHDCVRHSGDVSVLGVVVGCIDYVFRQSSEMS